MSSRIYNQAKRKSAQHETRERIVVATMALHDIKGVVGTSYVEIAEQAGVGAATVYRHFPNPGDLILACGAHVAAQMRPFDPTALPAVPEGVRSLEERLLWLCTELDAFYRRGGIRLVVAQNERSRVAELEQFMTSVEAGIDAMVVHALGPVVAGQGRRMAIALARMSVWESLRAGGLLEEGMGLWAATVGRAIELSQQAASPTAKD